MSDTVLRVVRLLRHWRYDPIRRVWRHRHHADLAVSTELLAALIGFVIDLVGEVDRKEEVDAHYVDR